MLHLDFETRSKVDLLKEGVYNYALDESTDVTMMAFAFDDDDPEIWIPEFSHLSPQIRKQLKDEGCIVHSEFPVSIKHYIRNGNMLKAHNAQFERLMFWYVLCEEYEIPEPKIEQFYCTATQARANNMPGKLDLCAKALGTDELKDKQGSDLIKRLCCPTDEGGFIEDVNDYVNFAKYCLQDVRAERSISSAMRELTEQELEDYVVSEIINDRGIKVDTELARSAARYADDEQADLIDSIQQLTNGKVKKARGKFMTQWVYDKLDEDQQSHMHKYKGGEKKLTLDRNARSRILNDPSVSALVKEVVEAADFAQASSTAKFKGMLNRADCEDSRVRGAYILFGAGSTHRYTSRGLQLHNMPRDGLKDPNKVRNAMIGSVTPDSLTTISGHNVMQTLKRLLRHSLIADTGKTYVCGDWGQIEGRMCPWLSMGISKQCDIFAQQKLGQFINQSDDYDVYCMAAESIYNDTVRRDGSKQAEERRQVGKVAELSLQFGGGEGAFGGMAVNYGVHMSDKEKEIVKTGWRQANPWAPVFWKTLHTAAVNAVRNPGAPLQAGRVSFCYQPGVMHGTLWCMLPSGNLLAYPHAEVECKEGKYGMQWELTAMKASWLPKADDKKWPRVTLWPGLIAENVTQGACAVLLRDLLAELVYTVQAPVVGHTHDEVLLEVASKNAERWREKLHDAMVIGSEWARGLPLSADIWTGTHYRK
jgi:DNA polymerase